MPSKAWSALRLRRRKLFIPVLHLLPLPGAPRATESFERIGQRMREEAAIYVEHGADALLLENHGDAPFPRDANPPQVVAAVSIYAEMLRREFGLPVGINLLRNDARQAMGAAAAAGASFIRVNVLTGVTATDQGIIEGCAAELLRYRASLGVDVAVLADIDVKFGTPLFRAPSKDLARSTLERGGADAVIVSGQATGEACDLDQLAEVKETVGDRCVLVGSGATLEALPDLLRCADGAIVGSCLKEDGYVENPVSEKRVAAFARAWMSI